MLYRYLWIVTTILILSYIWNFFSVGRVLQIQLIYRRIKWIQRVSYTLINIVTMQLLKIHCFLIYICKIQFSVTNILINLLINNLQWWIVGQNTTVDSLGSMGLNICGFYGYPWDQKINIPIRLWNTVFIHNMQIHILTKIILNLQKFKCFHSLRVIKSRS